MQASVIIVTYNHADYIRACLESVLEEGPAEIIVVDSGSEDGTAEIISEEFPEVTLYTPKENGGYGAGNNKGVEQIDTKYSVILNPDTKVEIGFLDALLKPLETNEDLITTPKILTYDGESINTCGNIDHFTGLGFTRGYGRPPDDFSEKEYLSGVSGACFAIRTDLYDEMGGFDESIFLYMDDVEFSWRAACEDIDILYTPSSIVYHDFPEVSVPPEKIFHVERGRYLILRKFLTKRIIVKLLPSLIFAEVLTTGYAILKGPRGLVQKFRAMKDGLTEDVDHIECDSSHVIGDLASRIPEDQLSYSNGDKFVKRIANRIFEMNHRLVKK